jgi:hypothetical protein
MQQVSEVHKLGERVPESVTVRYTNCEMNQESQAEQFSCRSFSSIRVVLFRSFCKINVKLYPFHTTA